MPEGTQFKMKKARVLHLLEELQKNSVEVASACIPPGRSRLEVEGLLENILDLKSIPENISTTIAASPTGAVVYWGSHQRYVLMPPFPLSEERTSPVCKIEPLYSQLQRDWLLALVLVRLGAYGIGVFQGERRLSSKVGTGLVHARHRQGGSSSHRFERHREKQMETFFTRVCVHLREQLDPYARSLEYLIYGGTRETLLEFRKQCHYTGQFDNRTLDILLNVRDPGQAGLQQGIEEAWSSRVMRWPPD